MFLNKLGSGWSISCEADIIEVIINYWESILCPKGKMIRVQITKIRGWLNNKQNNNFDSSLIKKTSKHAVSHSQWKSLGQIAIYYYFAALLSMFICICLFSFEALLVCIQLAIDKYLR